GNHRFRQKEFNLSLYIQKYGGTSVGTLDRIKSVAAHIAATYRAGHRVVVVVSAMGQQTMVLEAIQAGARDFIVKPFQEERVIDAITKVLK
ncbi:response regulator, partial [bacterium]